MSTFAGKFVIETSSSPAATDAARASLLDGNMYARWTSPAAVCSALAINCSARNARKVHCAVILP